MAYLNPKEKLNPSPNGLIFYLYVKIHLPIATIFSVCLLQAKEFTINFFFLENLCFLPKEQVNFQNLSLFILIVQIYCIQNSENKICSNQYSHDLYSTTLISATRSQGLTILVEALFHNSCSPLAIVVTH